MIKNAQRLFRRNKGLLKRVPGFTLFEIMIYTAIVGFFLVAAVYFAFVLSSSRARFIGRSFVYGNATRLLNTIDYLVRNADGYVTDVNGRVCKFPDKLWLYYATSSVGALPPGCMGQYASGMVGIDTAAATGWIEEGSVKLTAITSDDQHIYAAGLYSTTYWFIYKFFKEDLTPDESFGGGAGYVLSGVSSMNVNIMASDTTYLYVMGSTGNSSIIEKRLLTTGALETAFDTDGKESFGTNYSYMTIDDNYIYLLGKSGYNWKITKLRKDTGALCTGGACSAGNFGTGGTVTVTFSNVTFSSIGGIAVDSSYVYVAGGAGYLIIDLENPNPWTKNFLFKYTIGTGTLSTSADETGGSFAGLAYNGTSLYTVENTQPSWTVEKRNTSNLALDTTFGTAGVNHDPNPVGSTNSVGNIFYHNNALYVVGNTVNGGNAYWRIEKRYASSGSFDKLFDGDGLYTSSAVGSQSSWTSSKTTALTGDNNFIYPVGYAMNGSTPYGEIEKRSVVTGQLDGHINMVRMVCYQNYPNSEHTDDCSTTPPFTTAYRMNLTNPYTTYIDSAGFSVSTTTRGSRPGFDVRLQIGPVTGGLLFSPPTITPSTTAAFRLSP